MSDVDETMKDPHHHLPDGRVKRVERWISRHERRLLRWGFVLMFATSIATAYYGWQAQVDRDHDFEHFLAVAAERRDQSCVADEREHKDNVDALKRTYLALDSPTTREQLGPGLVRLIVQMLPQAESAARTDQAPKYCDEPGVGLPEPDPRPPDRRDFSHLLAPEPP
jgi:hypothetical protein